MAIRITSVRRIPSTHEDPHQAIDCLGWINDKAQKSGVSPRKQIYHWIRDKGGGAFILDGHNNIAYVGTRESSQGTEYVQAFANEVWTDTLLELPRI